jgi:hypothetical protein
VATHRSFVYYQDQPKPRRPVGRRIRGFLIDWLPVFASLMLTATILMMAYHQLAQDR